LLLEIEGALVSIDAIGCQKKIARQIVEQGGDYVLPVKENQEHLYQDLRDAFAQAIDSNYAGLAYDEYATSDRGHGRQEHRWYTVIYDPQGLRHQELWEKLRVIGMCWRERTVAGKTSTELHYFIGSRHASAQVYGEALRGHWGIENNLHWQLDVTFGEDASQIHDRYAAENFSWLRRVALMLLKRHPSKQSMARKRYEAALDPTFLEEILLGANKMGKL
jgi:predicted transposase YbfD/YdcC